VVVLVGSVADLLARIVGGIGLVLFMIGYVVYIEAARLRNLGGDCPKCGAKTPDDRRCRKCGSYPS
jgi:hypothetical protein